MLVFEYVVSICLAALLGLGIGAATTYKASSPRSP